MAKTLDRTVSNRRFSYMTRADILKYDSLQRSSHRLFLMRNGCGRKDLIERHGSLESQVSRNSDHRDRVILTAVIHQRHNDAGLSDVNRVPTKRMQNTNLPLKQVNTRRKKIGNAGTLWRPPQQMMT